MISEYLPEVIYDSQFELESHKIIRRIYVPFNKKFSIHNKDTWLECYEFFVEKMTKFELFFYEYEEFIKQVI